MHFMDEMFRDDQVSPEALGLETISQRYPKDITRISMAAEHWFSKEERLSFKKIFLNPGKNRSLKKSDLVTCNPSVFRRFWSVHEYEFMEE
jgi:hypothetical protein